MLAHHTACKHVIACLRTACICQWEDEPCFCFFYFFSSTLTYYLYSFPQICFSLRSQRNFFKIKCKSPPPSFFFAAPIMLSTTCTRRKEWSTVQTQWWVCNIALNVILSHKLKFGTLSREVLLHFCNHGLFLPQNIWQQFNLFRRQTN